MRKVEVLNDCLLAVKKGSIVLVDDRQFERARRILKPIEIEAKAEPAEIETAERPRKRKKKEEDTEETE